MRFIPLSIVLPAVLMFVSSALGEPVKPNIVVILADDFGYSDLGCYGGEIATPNVDRLAAQGVRFTQFYNAGRCCPTRASLLTGLYPHQAEMGWMTGNPRNIPGYRNELSHDAVTIPELLRTAGYATYMSGKWHVTSQVQPDSPRENWPLQRGFDRFYGTIKGGGSFYDPAMLCRGNTPITPEGDSEYKPEKFYYTDAISDHAVKFIREHHGQQAQKPLFMYVAYTAPHWPMHASEELVAKYKGKYDAGYEPVRAARFERMKAMGIIDPGWALSPQAWQWEEQEHKEWEARCMEVYAAMVERMDHGVGQIVEALTATGELDDTLILFLADNGACSEKMGRDVHEDRATAPATQPRDGGDSDDDLPAPHAGRATDPRWAHRDAGLGRIVHRVR